MLYSETNPTTSPPPLVQSPEVRLVMTDLGWTVYEYGEVKGWVRDNGCENPHCVVEMAMDRPYHAIPSRGLLPRYHYPSLDEAVGAVLSTEEELV